MCVDMIHQYFHCHKLTESKVEQFHVLLDTLTTDETKSTIQLIDSMETGGVAGLGPRRHGDPRGVQAGLEGVLCHPAAREAEHAAPAERAVTS